MPLRVYLAGPMRGIPQYNHPAFNAAAAKLEAEGHEVFSPAKHDQEKWPDRDWTKMTGDIIADGLTLGDMRSIIQDDLDWIAQNADAIALLPGWERSKGATAEHALAKFLGLWIREM